MDLKFLAMSKSTSCCVHLQAPEKMDSEKIFAVSQSIDVESAQRPVKVFKFGKNCVWNSHFLQYFVDFKCVAMSNPTFVLCAFAGFGENEQREKRCRFSID